MVGFREVPELVDQGLLRGVQPDAALRKIGLQRLDPELLIRGIDDRAHGKCETASCGPLCQNVSEKGLELHGFNGPIQAMIRAVQRNHVFDDTIGVALSYGSFHHVEGHGVAE